MNAMTLRDRSRIKLSPRYGAVHGLRLVEEQVAPHAMPTAELRRLVAMMID